eukprot:scaffold479_cov97-Cylindrotheca_fusiformis.AAC.9
MMALKSRKKKPWTPYHVFLTAMSTCDIILSLTVAIGSFLFPKGTSNQVWAIGNDASCSATGFLSQFSTSAFLYNAMLGFYFHASTRLRLSNEYISRRFEPLMHFISLGFPLATAFVGLFMDAYGERQGFLTCYIKTCPFDEDGNREKCNFPTLDLVFGRIVYVFVVGTLIINNIAILIFFRKQTRSSNRRTIGLIEPGVSNRSLRNGLHQEDHSMRSGSTTRSTTVPMTRREREVARIARANRKRRVRLLSTQAFLFIGSFIFCNFASFVMRFVVGTKIIFGEVPSQTMSYVEEMEFPYKYYPLMVLQAILYPLQGFINMIVYMRPKFANIRRQFPEQTRIWAFRRSIFGETVFPLSTQEREDRNKNSIFGSIRIGPRRNQIAKPCDGVDPKSSGRSSSDLEVIGETSETDFFSGFPSAENLAPDHGHHSEGPTSKAFIVKMDGTTESLDELNGEDDFKGES